MSGFEVFLLVLFGAGFLFLYFKKADKKSFPGGGSGDNGGGNGDDDKDNGDDDD